MIELLITITLLCTYQINFGGELRLVDILLVAIFVWGAIRQKKLFFDKNILTLIVIRIIYILLSLLILGCFSVATVMSMGYYIEFIFVFMIIHLYKANIDFNRMWNILSLLFIANTILALFQFVVHGGGVRSYGLFGSSSICYFLPLIIYGIFLGRDNLQKKKYLLFTVLGIIDALLSEQRTLILIIFINILVFMFMNKEISVKKFPKIAIGVIVGGLAIYYWIPESLKVFYMNKILEVFSSINVDNDSSMYVRYVLWECAVNMFKASPIIGIGSGMFARQGLSGLSKYTNRTITKRVVGLSTHNNFLEYLCELGSIGTILTYLLIIFISRNIKKMHDVVCGKETYTFKILYSSFISLCLYDFIGQSSFMYFWSFSILLIYSYIYTCDKRGTQIVVDRV